MKNFLNENIFFLLIEWHFFDVPKKILAAWKNFLKFTFEFFSISLLLKTFFYHWRRYRFFYQKKFNPWDYFQTFVFNVFSRLIGVVLRFFVLLLGFVLEIFVLIFGLIVFLSWIFLPLFLIIMVVYGFKIIL